MTKRYGPALAVDDVTLTLPEGAVHGLLGPNGAGARRGHEAQRRRARHVGARGRLRADVRPYFSLITFAMAVGTALVPEKQNRVTEMVLFAYVLAYAGAAA